MSLHLVVVLVLASLGPGSMAQLPSEVELAAERYLQGLYRTFGPPGSSGLEEALGHENVRALYEGLVKGYYLPEDADHLVRQILLERGKIVLPYSRPQRSGVIQPPSSVPLPAPTTPLFVLRPNPLLEHPPLPPDGERPARTSPPPPPALRPPPSAPAAQAPRAPRSLEEVLSQLERFLGPVGIQTTGGDRGQYPARLFSTTEILSRLRETVLGGGRLPRSTVPDAAVAGVQLLLFSLGYRPAPGGLDGLEGPNGWVSRTLEDFQRRSGLEASGRLDLATLDHLVSLSTRPRPRRSP